jgi:hypothetical protein
MGLFTEGVQRKGLCSLMESNANANATARRPRVGTNER